jgi:hypothetical protein
MVSLFVVAALAWSGLAGLACILMRSGAQGSRQQSRLLQQALSARAGREAQPTAIPQLRRHSPTTRAA